MIKQIATSLVGYEPKQVNGQNGPFTIHKFKAADNNVFDTTKSEIANAAYALLNQPVVVTYDESPWQKGDKSGVNRRLENVVPNDGQQVIAGPAAPAPVAALPPVPAPGPVAAAPAPIIPAQALPQVLPTVVPPDEVGPRISRSVAQEHGLKALELALKMHEHGISKFENPDQLLATASWVSNSAIALAKDAAGYIFQGPTTAAEPQAPTTDDDIPF